MARSLDHHRAALELMVTGHVAARRAFGVASERGSGVDARFGFDFDEHHWVDQALDLYESRRGPYVVEELTVRAADFLPILDVGHEDARAKYVLDPAARAFERPRDVAQTLRRLQRGITGRGDRPVFFGRRGARYIDGIAHAHGARITDNGLVFGAARDVSAIHGRQSSAPHVSYVQFRAPKFDGGALGTAARVSLRPDRGAHWPRSAMRCTKPT